MFCVQKYSITSWAKRGGKALLILGSIAATLAACGQAQAPPPDTAIAQPTATEEQQPPAPTTDLPTQELTPILPVPDGPLSKSGPWLVFSTEESLWGVNRDGTGLTKISDQVANWRSPIGPAVAPFGGQVAYITSGQERFQLTLNVFSFAANQSMVITGLTSYESDPDAVFERAGPLAVLYSDSLVWSPDGNQLAFVGIIEGPTSDLYVYSAATGEVDRLTSGPSQAYQLSWSPDGETILHFGVDTFGTGAGYTMEGVWTAGPDGSEVKSPYKLQDSYSEKLVGWIDGDTFVVHSWDPSCSAKNLRAVNRRNGNETILWGDYFMEAALDPNSGNVLIAADDRISACNLDGRQGLFLAAGDGTNMVKIIDDDPYQVVWSLQAELFFARTEFGILAIGSNGEWVQIHDFTGQIPVSSPVDKVLAWYGDEGLWVGNMLSSLDELQPVRIFSQPVKAAVWGPEGEYLFFFSEDSIFVTHLPDQEIMLVAEGIYDDVVAGGNAAWVYP